MGYMKHNAIVVTNWNNEELKRAHDKAIEIFDAKFDKEPLGKKGSSIISPIIGSIINSQTSFFIAPDGSKEGWTHSDIGDEARKEFLDWLLTNNNFSDYAEIAFGGDYDEAYIIRHKESDIENF